MPVRLESQPVLTEHALQRLRERVLPLLRSNPEWDHRLDEDTQLRAWADATLEGAVITPTSTGAWQVARRVTAHTMVVMLLMRRADHQPWIVVTARVLGASSPTDKKARAKRLGRHVTHARRL